MRWGVRGVDDKNKDKDQVARAKRFKSRADKREEIRSDLLEQLQDRNILEAHFTDLVNDYISLWDVKNELIHDIETKGVSVKYQNGANQWGYKKNDSVSELNRVNGQMLTIIKGLGLSPVSVVADDDNDFSL